MSKILTVLMVLVLGLAVPGLAIADDGEARLREDEEGVVLVAEDEDGKEDDTGSNGGSAASNDATDSRYTPVSRDRDLSRGDLTRDWTDDGPGGKRRDYSRNSTNDGTRNDTR